MFTGIVEEIGTLRRMKPAASSCTLTISCEKVLEGTKLGDSIAVNGTCLTVTRMDTNSFDCDVTPETLSRTSFSMVRVTISLIPHTGEKTILLGKRPGDPVNVECDYLGKYVEQLMKKDTEEGLTMGMLETLSGGNYGI